VKRSACAIAILLIACQSAPLADIEPGAAPALESDEAGFWMSMEKAEQDLATSGNRIDAPELDAYLKGVICKIAEEYCSAVRVYVMRQPDFNASMAPNGMMVVWSGLLIRVQNEAQLAAVLGHEIGHYQRRHTLSIMRRLRKTTTALTAIALLTGAVVPAAADAATLIGLGTLMHHSREHEAEADSIGIQRIAAAGYDPREVAEIWSGIAREAKADKEFRTLGFFATHPAPETRLRDMAAQGEKLLTPQNDRNTGAARFDEVVVSMRTMLLSDEIAMRKHERTNVVIDRLLETETISPEAAAFFRAELFRVRGEKGDAVRAVALYREAISGPEAPPLAYRNLGLVLRRLGEKDLAREAFENYLARAPDANDRAMVETYIQELAQ
jgi:predicted Zn-dependent protease